MVLVRVTYVDYDDSDDDLQLLVAGRGEDGKRYSYRVSGVEPWGYVPADVGGIENYEGVQRATGGFSSYDGVPLKRVVTEHPSDVGNIADEIDEMTYETDIPFDRKCSIYDGFSGYIEAPQNKSRVHISSIETDPDVPEGTEIEPRVVIADIEVKMGDETFREMEKNATQPVIMIAAHDPFPDEYHVFFYEEGGSYNSDLFPQHMTDHWEKEEMLERYWEAPTINIHQCEDEKHLLAEFGLFINKTRPDLISGWNWIGFDHEYLLNRFEKKNVSLRPLSDFTTVKTWKGHRSIYGLPGFDMMESYTDKIERTGLRSKALDYVAETKLGIGKVDNININYAWENNIERLLAYNLIDVQLCVELDRREGIHDFFYDLAEMSGIHVYDMFTKQNNFSEMRIVDGSIMSRRGDDEVLPMQYEKDLEKNAGGFVKEAPSGIQENLSVFDLKSLYPSCIATWNISTETLTWDTDEADLIVPWTPEPKKVKGKVRNDDISMDKFGTTTEKQGIIPKYLNELFEVRDDLKKMRDRYSPESDHYGMFDRRQAAIKVIMNSFYGTSANPYWRLAREGMGDAITSAARYTLWKGVEISENMGYNVEYSDTDSIFLHLGKEDLDDIINEGSELVAEVNAQMDSVADEIGIKGDHPHLPEAMHGTSRQCLVWEFEKVYESFIQLGQKKRYAGLITWKEGKKIDPPKVDVSGFESQRSDSPEITEVVQEEVLSKVLHGEGFDSVSEYVRSKIEGLEGNPRSFAMPGSLNKPPEEYPNREIPRACIYSNEQLGKEFGSGDEMFVYYVDKVPSQYDNIDVIALEWNEDVPDGFTLDKEAMIRKALRLPLSPIIEEMGWTFSQIRSGKQPGSLDTPDDFEFGKSSNSGSNKSDGGITQL